MHHGETSRHPPDVINSPLVQRYLAEDGPSSPYRESVTFIRQQLQLSAQEAERQRDYWRRMNIRHEHQVRPVTDEEYQRLATKTLLQPTRTHLEPDTEINIARWPQSERHIRGVDAWHPPSARPHAHLHPEQLQQQFTDSELSRLLEGESRELKEHIESVYDDFAGSDAGSGPHLPICTPSALRAMQGEEEDAERGGDEFDRLTASVPRKQSHTHKDNHTDMRRGSHRDAQNQIETHTNVHVASPVPTQNSARACKSPLCEVSQTEIDVFSLSDAEISAIESLREKLLLVVDVDSTERATHTQTHPERNPQRFSPSSGTHSAQSPIANAYNDSNAEIGERYTYAHYSPVAQHTHTKQRPKSVHRRHTQTPEKRGFSTTATTPLRLPATLFPQSPLPSTRTSDLFPDRRMSPMEMKRFRIAHEQSANGGGAEDVTESRVLDPDVYFTMRALRDERSTHSVPPLALGSPHPEIKGQFVVPPDGESAREREREIERERQKLDELISQANANAVANAKEHANANTSTLEENENGNDENEETEESGNGSVANNATQQSDSHSHSQSTPSQRTNDTETPRQPAVRPALSFSPALLGDLKAGRSLRATPAKTNDSAKEGADTKSAKEKEERERAEQAERYQRFRHNMLVHHVCEFSRERFSTVKLLGRGKFAAVYSAQKNAPLSASRSLKEKRVSSDSADDRADETMAFLRTIFRCHDSASVESNEDESSSDANKQADGLHGALKVAQFKDNGQSETVLPPISVLEEFEREILALRALPHPHIVRLLGYCASPFSIVMELVKGENLHNALKNIPLQCAAGIAERVSVAKDIVSALEFMHQKHYVHRDIKSHNVLIAQESDGKWSAKIADLGAAVKLSFAPSTSSVDGMQLLHEPMGTSGYTAPEILRTDHVRYAYPADVFSVAIVLWELFTKVQSEEELTLLDNPLCGLNPSEAYDKIMNGLRPSLEGEFFKSSLRLRETISFAWASEAQDRLTMSQLLHSLEAI